MPIEPNRYKNVFRFEKMENSGLDPRVIEYCRTHCITTIEKLYASMKVSPEAHAKYFATLGFNDSEYATLLQKLSDMIPEDLRKRLDNRLKQQRHGAGLFLE